MFGIRLSQVDFTMCICECLVLNDQVDFAVYICECLVLNYLKYIIQCIYVNVWY